MSESACRFCGANRLRTIRTVGVAGTYGASLPGATAYTIARCELCRMVYVKEQIAPDLLQSLYSGAYFHGGYAGGYVDYEAQDARRKREYAALLAVIEAGGPRGSLLEVGCATGTFLDVALSRGWRVTGIEVSDHAAGIARTKGHKILTGSIESAGLPEDAFDVCACWESIGHMANPRDFLRHARRHLRPGGRIFLSTVDLCTVSSGIKRLRGSYFRPPFMLSYFSHQTLRTSLEDGGFRVLGGGFKLPVVPVYLTVKSIPLLALNPMSVMVLFAEKPL